MCSLKISTDRFFPAKDYQEVCKKNRALSVTYLIARDHKNIESLAKEINTLDGKKANWRRPVNLWKLTPLHLAVWRQNLPAIQVLLDKQCDSSAKDSLGFMPLDYAEAIGNVEVIELIRAATKVDRVSYANVWKGLLEKPAVDKDASVFSYEHENGSIVPGNSAQFAALTQGAEFARSIYFKNREALLTMIENELNNTYNKIVEIEFDPAILETLLTEEVPLHLKRQEGAGYGVVASKPLEAFKPVVIYAGEGVLESDHDKSALSCAYYFPPFEAHKQRNLGGMVNDGFPNCTFETIHHPSGIAYTVIVPVREIAAGEELFIDYGNIHDVKMMKRIEFNGDEARAFLKEKSFAAWAKGELLPLIRRLEEGKHLTQREMQKLTAIKTKLSYLVHTPSLLVPLILENRVKQEDISVLSSDPSFIDFVCTEDEQRELLQKFVILIGTLDSAQQRFQWDVKGELLAIINELLLKYHADTVNIAFMFFTNCLKDALKTSVPMPKGTLRKMYLPSFEHGAIFFETTRSCFLRREDANEEELALLDKISQADPMVEKIYTTFYAQIVTDRFPKLKSFIHAKRKEMLDRNASGQGPMHDLSRVMRNMAPNGMPPQVESLFASMEANPDLQNAFLDAVMQKFNK